MLKKNHLLFTLLTLTCCIFTPLSMIIPLITYIQQQYHRLYGLIISNIAFCFINIVSSSIKCLPYWGDWSWFTYSGLLLINIAQFKKSPTFSLFNASIIYWVWSNFGTWVQTSLYPHTATGLLQCYWMALPFLQQALLGTCMFCLLTTVAKDKLRIPCQHIILKARRQLT